MNEIEIIEEKIRILTVVRDEIIDKKIYRKSSCYDTSICRRIWCVPKINTISLSNLYKIKVYLTNYISKSLGRHTYYHHWLENKLKRYPTPQEAKEARIQWLSWMIRCYEEKLEKLQK